MVTKKFAILFTFIFICLIPLNASAWTTEGEVTEVMSHNEKIVIKTTITDGPCPSTSMFYWPTSDSDSKDMLSIALAALMSGKKIKVAYPEGAPCSGVGPMITHIRILK